MYYLIKCITIWNWMKDKGKSLYNSTVYFYCYILDYFYNTHNKWIFSPGYPVPMNQIIIIPNNNKWEYNSTNNILSYHTNDIKCSFSWLSAKLVVYENENEIQSTSYDIDEFISTLRVYTIANRPPTLMMIYMLWCIYAKQYFSSSTTIEFHIIDDMGEQYVYYSQHVGSLTIRNQKIY